MGVKNEGLDEEIEALKFLADIFDEEISKELNELGIEWVDDCKENTPVVTGLLRRSWTFDGVKSKGKNKIVEVSNNTEYAAHWNYGHRVKAWGKYTGKVVKGTYLLEHSRRRAYKTLAERIKRAADSSERRVGLKK